MIGRDDMLLARDDNIVRVLLGIVFFVGVTNSRLTPSGRRVIIMAGRK